MPARSAPRCSPNAIARPPTPSSAATTPASRTRGHLPSWPRSSQAGPTIEAKCSPVMAGDDRPSAAQRSAMSGSAAIIGSIASAAACSGQSAARPQPPRGSGSEQSNRPAEQPVTGGAPRGASASSSMADASSQAAASGVCVAARSGSPQTVHAMAAPTSAGPIGAGVRRGTRTRNALTWREASTSSAAQPSAAPSSGMGAAPSTVDRAPAASSAAPARPAPRVRIELARCMPSASSRPIDASQAASGRPGGAPARAASWPSAPSTVQPPNSSDQATARASHRRAVSAGAVNRRGESGAAGGTSWPGRRVSPVIRPRSRGAGRHPRRHARSR